MELLADWQVPAHEIFTIYPVVSSLSRNARLWLEVAEHYYKQYCSCTKMEAFAKE